MRTNRRIYTTKVVASFLNFANAPKNSSHLQAASESMSETQFFWNITAIRSLNVSHAPSEKCDIMSLQWETPPASSSSKSFWRVDVSMFLELR